MGALTQAIKDFAEYVMRGRREAILMAVLFSVIPFMAWVAAIILALVTLRKGARDGLIILMWMAIPGIIFAAFGYKQMLIMNVLGGGLVIWLLAMILRETNSWRFVLQTGCVLGMIAVIVVHFFKPDIDQYWFHQMNQHYTNAASMTDLSISKKELQSILQKMSVIYTGAQAAILLLSNLVTLAMGRWLQALLYNPGGFSEEFYNIRLGLIANICLASSLLMMLLGYKVGWDLLPVPFIIFFFAGLSLIHGLAARLKIKWGWLFSFYLILIFLYRIVPFIVVLLAWLDSWVNVRKFQSMNKV